MKFQEGTHREYVPRTERQTKPWYRYLTKEDRKAFFAAWIGVLLDGYDFVLISPSPCPRSRQHSTCRSSAHP